MKLTLLFILIFLVSCQTQFRRSETQGTIESSAPEAPQESPKNESMRLGLILGPGGARGFAHVGFLRQLQLKRIPVHAIVGLETGALVAASFAQKGSGHEAEWQLSKIKEEKFSDEGGSILKFLSPIKTYLESVRAENGKIPFSCPSLNLRKSQVFMMARGRLDQLLPFCLAYPPVFESFERTVAATREIPSAVDYLRSHGVNYIVFVNVLGGLSPDEPTNWQELSYDMKRKWPGVQDRLDLVIGSKSISDYKSRIEVIQLGAEQSASFVENLTTKL